MIRIMAAFLLLLVCCLFPVSVCSSCLPLPCLCSWCMDVVSLSLWQAAPGETPPLINLLHKVPWSPATRRQIILSAWAVLSSILAPCEIVHLCVCLSLWSFLLICCFFCPSWATVVISPPACLSACLPTLCLLATGSTACLPASATAAQPPSWERPARRTLATSTQHHHHWRRHQTRSTPLPPPALHTGPWNPPSTSPFPLLHLGIPLCHK